MQKFTIVAITGLIAGAGGGAIARGSGAGEPASPRTAAIGASDNHGHAPLVTIELEPARVTRGAAGERMELMLAMISRSSRQSAVRYAYEVVDERGNELAEPFVSTLAALAPRGVHAARIAIPDGVPDGYFTVRVTAVAADGKEDTAQIAERYFQADRGSVTPVTSDEWLSVSNLRHGRPL